MGIRSERQKQFEKYKTEYSKNKKKLEDLYNHFESRKTFLTHELYECTLKMQLYCNHKNSVKNIINQKECQECGFVAPQQELYPDI